MKLNKTILAAVLGMSAAGLSNAGTVYITGSTALRSSVQKALITSGTVFNGVPAYTVFQGGTAGNNAGNGGNYMGFVGTDLNGQPLTVQCHWSGSEAGVKDAALGLNGTFIDPSLLDGVDHGTNVPSTTVSAQVDLAMADNSQEFSRTVTPVLFTNKFVGIITFKWVRNNGLFTGTNVSSAQIQQALNGYAPRSLFTGDTNHQGDYVYVSGRDDQSGTRVNAFGDSGFGILSTPTQVQIDKTTGNMIEVGGLGSGIYSGDYGFSSGGTLAGTLGVSTVGKTDQVNGGTGGFSVISYLSNGDAATAVAAGAKELSVDGVAFSRDAIIEGNYNFWGNAYIFQRQSPVASSQAQYTYTKLASGGIETAIGHTSASAIPVGDMHATRNGPSAVPTHN